MFDNYKTSTFLVAILILGFSDNIQTCNYHPTAKKLSIKKLKNFRRVLFNAFIKTTTGILKWTLLKSGDIETNPGPVKCFKTALASLEKD